MEIITDERIIELLMMLVGSALLGLVGFVWKISHKVSENSKRIDSLSSMQQKDIAQLNRDIDMIISKVDKQGEWATNRMMSIAKEMPR
tara:strand:- start:295 stop:558 length:264 start_codon:yes stop_codon:yes gene_type:complete